MLECSEKTELLATVTAAMKLLMDRRMKAFMAGRLTDSDGLDEDLTRQRQIKDDLLQSYRKHVQSHGC